MEKVTFEDFYEVPNLNFDISRLRSDLDKKQNLLTSGFWIILLDTCIAMLAGTAIFSIVFAMGADPAEGPGLIFVVLPTIFPQISGGLIWGTLFFFILYSISFIS